MLLYLSLREQPSTQEPISWSGFNQVINISLSKWHPLLGMDPQSRKMHLSGAAFPRNLFKEFFFFKCAKQNGASSTWRRGKNVCRRSCPAYVHRSFHRTFINSTHKTTKNEPCASIPFSGTTLLSLVFNGYDVYRNEPLLIGAVRRKHCEMRTLSLGTCREARETKASVTPAQNLHREHNCKQNSFLSAKKRLEVLC